MTEEIKKKQVKTNEPINSLAEASIELAELTRMLASINVQLADARRREEKCHDWEGRVRSLRALAEERRLVLKQWIRGQVAQEIAKRRQAMEQMFAAELNLDNDLDLHKVCLRVLHDLKKTLFDAMTEEQRDMLILVLAKLHDKIAK